MEKARAGEAWDIGNLLTRPKSVWGPQKAPSPLSSLLGSSCRANPAHQHVVPVVAGSLGPPGDDPAPLAGIGFTRALLGEESTGVVVNEEMQLAHRFRDRDQAAPARKSVGWGKSGSGRVALG